MINILNNDGIANYHGTIMSKKEADRFYELLFKNIEWKNDKIAIFGKHITTKRKVAWYGDSDYSYSYSNTSKQALRWTTELLELKKRLKK